MQRPANLKVKLISKILITSTILEVKYQLFESFTFVPGQFTNISVTLPYRRPYSVLDYDEALNIISFIIEIKDPGKGSDYFRNAELGLETIIMGPLGKYCLNASELPKVFIATGTGVAPFIPMLKQLKQKNFQNPISIFQGMRYLADDCTLEYLKPYIDSGFIKYIQCVTRDDLVTKLNQSDLFKTLSNTNQCTTKGRVTDIVPEFGFNYSEIEFYVCGSNQMVKDMRLNLNLLGGDKVFIENYG